MARPVIVMDEPEGTVQDPRQALRDVFHFSEYRDGQEEAITSILQGRDTMFITPTGGGKSLVYQIPALCWPGLTLVVSPLISLMKDQVDGMREIRYPAAFFNSTLSDSRRNDVINGVNGGTIKLLYIAPEGITPRFLDAMAVDVSMLAVDEAHCHPAGTIIVTRNGLMPIEDVQKGDWVLSWSHELDDFEFRCVTSVRSRVVDNDSLLKMETLSTNLVSTEDHPVGLCDVGYVPQGAFREGDEIWRVDERSANLFRLRATVPSISQGGEVLQPGMLRESAASEDAREARRDLPKLWREVRPETSTNGREGFGGTSLLFARVLDRVHEQIGPDGNPDLCGMLQTLHLQGVVDAKVLLEGVCAFSNGRLFIGSHDPRESNDIARRATEGVRSSEEARRSIQGRRERRKRASDIGFATTCVELVSFTRGRVSYLYRRKSEWSAVVRVPGSGRSRKNEGHRGGRGVAQFDESPEFGRKSRPVLTRERLVRTPCFESRHHGEIGTDQGNDTRVFALGVDGNNNYFANGILVHNCISQWGHDFRPKYLRLKKVLNVLGRPPCLATTATATDVVRKDIAEQLGLRNPNVLVRGFDRPNLRIQVYPVNYQKKEDLVFSFVQQVPGSVIVYCGTQRAVEGMAQHLRNFGIEAAAYHGGMTGQQRTKIQEAFMRDQFRVVVATNAFGMGVDKPDVRAVVHYQMPGSLEAYYQEIGRAGRDGDPAAILLLYKQSDRNLHDFFTKMSWPPNDVVKAVFEWTMYKAQEREGDKLFVSQRRVAAIVSDMFGVEAQDAQIGSVWQMMERAGVIKRYRANDICKLALIECDEVFRGVPQRLMELLHAKYVMGAWYEVSTIDLAKELGTDKNALSAALRSLQQVAIEYQPPERSGGVVFLEERGINDVIDWEYLDRRRQMSYRLTDIMARFAQRDVCRRAQILRYFGDNSQPDGWRCGTCDVCKRTRK